jgi:hypothetical protein
MSAALYRLLSLPSGDTLFVRGLRRHDHARANCTGPTPNDSLDGVLPQVTHTRSGLVRARRWLDMPAGRLYIPSRSRQPR